MKQHFIKRLPNGVVTGLCLKRNEDGEILLYKYKNKYLFSDEEIVYCGFKYKRKLYGEELLGKFFKVSFDEQGDGYEDLENGELFYIVRDHNELIEIISKVKNDFVVYKHKKILLNNLIISNLNSLKDCFIGKKDFNTSLNRWDTSNIENMEFCLSGCSNFNHSLNNWDFSKVKTLECFLLNATNFNSPFHNLILKTTRFKLFLEGTTLKQNNKITIYLPNTIFETKEEKENFLLKKYGYKILFGNPPSIVKSKPKIPKMIF